MGDAITADAAQAGFDEADLEAIRDSIATVLTEQCGSIAVHAYVDGNRGLADVLEEQGRNLGWAAIGLPEDQGGFGLGARGVQLLHQELGKVVAPGGFLPTGVVAQVLSDVLGDCGGDQAALGDWLSRLLSGEAQAAIPPVIEGRVTQRADGAVVGKLTLLGSPAAAIGLVPVGDAGLALVDLTGLERTPLDFWDRTRSLFEVQLDGTVPLTWLGEGDFARRALTRVFAIAVAADCVGLARGIADKTIAYMKDRVQFGRPIGSFQALKHRAVELAARIGIAEHMLAQAVEVAAAGDAIADRWARLAKAAASDAAVFVAGDCVQLHGGVGFTWEYDVHLYLKRARLNEMLVADNLTLRDAAAADLATVTRAGASTLELPAL